MLYTKRSKKKHKSWLDGYIIIKNDRTVELLNEDGKKIASERYKPLGGMKEGNTLEIASWELEVQSNVDEQDYLSGRLFVKPTLQAAVASSITRQPSVRRSSFKPLRPRNPASKLQTTANQSPGPLHDPTSPESCILMPSVVDKFSGKSSVPVVLDPFLAKQMRPHQREGIKFLYKCVQGSFFFSREGGQGAILADEMGLGKSLQAIALVWTLLKQSPTGHPVVKKAVIVCPASLVQNWINEVKKWLGCDRLNPVAVTSGSSTFESKEAFASFVSGDVRRLLIVSYEMFRSYSEQLYKSKIGLLVCDEGHRLKSSHGNKTIEALKALPCRARVILTGTPVQNDLEEFYAVCDFVNPGCLNSLSSFRQIFASPIIASRDSNASRSVLKIGEARAKELGRITATFVLRRTSTILAKYLPPKQEIAIFCRLADYQDECYRKEARSYFDEISHCSRFSVAFSAITALRKICCHPKLMSSSSKGDILGGDTALSSASAVENVSEDKQVQSEFRISDSTKMQVAVSVCLSCLAVKDKLIMVSNYTSALDLLQLALAKKGVSFCRLDGSTPVSKRGDIVRRFNSGTNGDVFLLSAKAGGVGLNLIGANRLILFDPDWNPATDLQAMARVWRDGQKKPVFVYRLLCTGTIEEKIFQRQLFKGELQCAVEDKQEIHAPEVSHTSPQPGKHLDVKEGNFSVEELRDLFQYDGNLKYCDTLDVLERSQADSLASKRNTFAAQASLLRNFSVYKNEFESDGYEGDVQCEDDPVLERALNTDLDTKGLVSYLYTTKTTEAKETSLQEENAKRDQPTDHGISAEMSKRPQTISAVFQDDVETEESSEDEEIEIILAMRQRCEQARAQSPCDSGEPRQRNMSRHAVSPPPKRLRTGEEVDAPKIASEQGSRQEDAQRWDEAFDMLEAGTGSEF